VLARTRLLSAHSIARLLARTCMLPIARARTHALPPPPFFIPCLCLSHVSLSLSLTCFLCLDRCLQVCVCLRLRVCVYVCVRVRGCGRGCVCSRGCGRSECTALWGWLRLVGSLKLQVSLAEYRLFNRALLQKRPIILRSLLIVATPYQVKTQTCLVNVNCDLNIVSFIGLFCKRDL